MEPKDLVSNVVELCKKSNKNKFRYLYSDETPILGKIEKLQLEFIMQRN